MTSKVVSSLLLAGFAASAGTASASTPVTFVGSVVNLCVLTLSTPGTLGLAASGTRLSSQEAGGLPAVVAVVASGTNPTLGFAAPQLTTAGGSTAGSTVQLAFASPGGASRDFDSTSYSFTTTRLLDNVTVRAMAESTAGFRAGVYTVSTTATCQQ